MITKMEKRHVRLVVDTHLGAFEGFFLSFLGPRFLHLYYESIVEYPDAAGYVWEEDGRVIGFVCGVVGPSNFYRYLIRTRWWRFAGAAVGATLRRPSIVPHLFRAFTYPGQTPRQADSGTLTSIAVEPSVRGRGIGARLVAAFLDDMRGRGVERVDLTTDRDGNEEVNRFYQGQGFQCVRTFVTSEGREMNEYMIVL